MKEQLFMLHFSGGSVYSFTGMFNKLKDAFIVEPIELPGRGLRFDEELIYDRKKAVNDLLSQIRKKRNGQPFFIYGHSLGAELGLLIVKELELMNDHPGYLIVSGNPGPNVRDDEKLHKIPDLHFWERLKELGGVSAELLGAKELIEIYEPILRADFEILEENPEPFVGKIKTPVFAIMGSEEKSVNKILNWENYIEGKFSHRILAGNHFCIYENVDAVCEIIIQCKSQLS